MATDAENERLLDKLLEGSSPQAPTYVLATILSDFTATKGSTELSVRRGDDVYIMFALEGWAFVANMKPGGQRGYVPLNYCDAVQDFYASPAVDIQNKRGDQQRKRPAVDHYNGHSTGEEASSTDLAAQPCEIYPPPKEFQSGSTSECDLWQNQERVEPTSRYSPPHAETGDDGRARATGVRLATAAAAGSPPPRADCRGLPALGSLSTSCCSGGSGRQMGNAFGSAMAACSLGPSSASVPLTSWSSATAAVREAACPLPREPDCCHCCSGFCRNGDRKQGVPLSPALTLPQPLSTCDKQDESGIGESNGSSSSSSSLDWCWDAPLLLPPPPPPADAAADIRSVASAAADSAATSSFGSNSRSSCCDSLEEEAEDESEEAAAAADMCPCCLCPWPCANTTTKSTSKCLCQSPPHYAELGRPAALLPVGGRRQQQAEHGPRGFGAVKRGYEDGQCGSGKGGSRSSSALDDPLLLLLPPPPLPPPRPSSAELQRSLSLPRAVATATSCSDDEALTQARGAHAGLPREARSLHSPYGHYPTRSVTFNLQPTTEELRSAVQRLAQQHQQQSAEPRPGRPWYEPYR